MNLMIISSLLFLAAGALLLSLVVRKRIALGHAVERLGGDVHLSAMEALSEHALRSNSKFMDREALQLLNQLGWRSARQRTLFLIVQITLPLVLLLAVLVAQNLGSEQSGSNLTWLIALFALGIGYLIPKRVIGRAVKARQERLAAEVSTLVPMLRMLFEVGMTVEQALRILADEGEEILPELKRELKYVLLRVDAGLELGRELRELAFVMQVDELTDCFAILEQLIQQGGGGMQSLLSLKELLDDRRMTTLQERVSKMSAKMSVVMMVFLFPALLIVLAGPGFIAIIQALGDMG